MTGRRAVVGLSLLCALLFSALVAQSASATKGTTAFTCSSGAAAKGFSDAHCDKGTSEGSYGHIGIEPDQEVEIEITNAKTKNGTTETTPAVLKSVIFKVSIEISCSTVSGSGKATNKVIGETMQNEGTGIGIKYSGCTVLKPTKGCQVKESLEITGSSLTVETLGAGKNEMGVEFKPKAGKPFAEIIFEGSECALKGKAVPLTGTAIATGSRGSTEGVTSSGATLIFTNEMTKETLKLGEQTAELSSTVALNVKEEGEVRWPISFSTAGEEGKTVGCGETEFPEENCELWENPESEEELEKEFEPEEIWEKEEGEESLKNPVLFIHGYDSDASVFHPAIKEFEKAGYKPGWLRSVSYKWWQSNATTAKEVETWVNGLKTATGSAMVDIVAHSMGALPARFYIKELKGIGAVHHLVTIASPNRGTDLAEKCEKKHVSCAEMVPGSAFLKKLNSVQTPGGVNSPIIGTWRSAIGGTGSCDWVVTPPETAEIGGTAQNKTSQKCLGHSALPRDTETIKEVREFIEKP
jgi:triacylglycerol lipase